MDVKSSGPSGEPTNGPRWFPLLLVPRQIEEGLGPAIFIGPAAVEVLELTCSRCGGFEPELSDRVSRHFLGFAISAR